jgi:integrase
VLAVKEPRHRDNALAALAHFERIARPRKMNDFTSQAVALFVSRRSKEAGVKPGSVISPATVNKELRYLRAVLRKAHRWGYLAKLPEFDFLKEPKKLATFVPPDHFVSLYQACDAARFPKSLPVPLADWWRALLVTAYMTGWRIGSLLALRWEDVDLDAGTALSRAEDNKGGRDQLVPLHLVAVAHLRKVRTFSTVVFPWDHSRRTLFAEFGRLQKAAGVGPAGPKKSYGFHDLRRAFATMNADRLTSDVRQHLMQHQDYQTTQRYINLARQLNPAAQNLFVPDLPDQERA